MNSKLEKIEENIATLEIEVEPEQFEQGLKKAYKKNVGRFNVPGFRKGKAPMAIIERYYGESVFYEDAINILCPDAYEEAVEQHGIEPVDTPKIDIVDMGRDKGLVFKAIVTVKPEVKLGQYKGIELEKKEYPVNDEEVDKELEGLRNTNARMVSVQDRPAKEGDMVIIDFEGFIDDEPFEGGSAENYSLILGSGQFIPWFEDQLVGANTGDHVDVKVTFPDDYHAEELAGQQAVFKVTVKEIKEKELPDLDDEFAKDVSELDTLEQLKQDIRQSLEKRAEARAKNEMQNQAVKKVVELSEVNIPDVMIEKQVDTMVKDFEMQLMYQGLKLDNYLEATKTSLEDFRNSLKKDAEDRVKSQLVIEKISQVEGITETQEELDAEIEEMTKRYRLEDIEKFKQSLGENELNYLKDSIIVRKTIELLVENANIK